MLDRENKVKSLKSAWEWACRIFGKNQTKEPVETKLDYEWKPQGKYKIDIASRGEDALRIEKIADRLAQTPTGRYLLDKCDYEIRLMGGMTARGTCMDSVGRIMLNKNLHDDTLVATLAHEMRHSLQAKEKNITKNASENSPETQLLLTRLKEADANAYAAQVSWELKEIGKDDSVWKKFAESYPHISKPYEKAMQETGIVEKAMSEGAKGWFKNEDIREVYDSHFFDDFIKTSRDAKYSDSYSRVISPEKLLNRVCKFKGGVYLEEKPENLQSKTYLKMSEEYIGKVEKFFILRLKKHEINIPKGFYKLAEVSGFTPKIPENQEKSAKIKLAQELVAANKSR